MKYFTPELYLRYQSSDDAEAVAADEEWERVADLYKQRLDEIWGALPQPARDLVDRYYLHDALVLSMARNEQSFILTLRLDPPPHDCLVLIYTLDGEPRIETSALPSEQVSRQVEWMYDELDLLPDSQSFSHEIFLSNGWCVFVPFKAVQVVFAAELLPGAPPSDGHGGRPLARTA